VHVLAELMGKEFQLQKAELMQVDDMTGKALVTGGAGFIGSHIVDRLLDQNFDVLVIDNFTTGHHNNLVHRRTKNLHIIKGDIRNFEDVKLAMKDADVVFHEAAIVSPVLSVKNPVLTDEVNVRGTLNLLIAARKLGVKRFIFASSAAVYGDVPFVHKKEDMIPAPTSPYGVSKLAAESYVQLFYKLYGIKTISLRYFNVYGPRQVIGSAAAHASVIPIFTDKLSQDMPLPIYGDGMQTRDFVYVKDVVEANMLALKCDEGVGEVFNIGSGTRVTINQIAELLKGIANKKNLANSYLPQRPTDIRHGYADISKAMRVLGYVPRFSIRKGLREFFEQYMEKNTRPTRAPFPQVKT
jgi:nucleoside-diphosphate-sugar epimerase